MSAVTWALLGLAAGGTVLYLDHRSRPKVYKDEPSPFGGIDYTETGTERWMTLAALAPQYTETVLRRFHGHAMIDDLVAEAKTGVDVGGIAGRLPTYNAPDGAGPEERLAAIAPRYAENVLRVFHDYAVEAGEVAPVVPLGAQPLPISFRPGEPQCFEEADSQQHIVRAATVFVNNLTVDWPALRPQSYVGGAGRGKTAMAKLLGQEIRTKCELLGLPTPHFIEAIGGDVNSAEKLDSLIRLASSRPGSVLFIDEIHSASKQQRERMYMMLDRDARFQFTGDLLPSQLAPFTILLATTDRGLLDEPFRTRCQTWELDSATQDELFHIAMHQPFEVDPVAASLAISRIHWDGSVRPLIQILEIAMEFAKAAGRRSILEEDIEQVFEVERMDEWGLRPHDRSVVRVLIRAGTPVKVKKDEAPRMIYKMAESTLCSWSRVDIASYREEVKPRLMDRGFIVSTSQGQVLTEAGIAYAIAGGLTKAA